MTALTRRSFVASLAAASAVLDCPLCLAKPITYVKNVLCATHSFSGLAIGDVLKTTGDRDLDESLVSEMTKQSAFFGYRPAFILYSGGEKNAAATPDAWPEIPATQGTILYNIEMLQEQLKASTWGGAILAGVIAHEFGHIYQSFSGQMSKLKALDTTVKFIELHADYLSGFYMGGKFGSIDVKPYADAFFKIGDYGFSDPDHHGTPEERYFVLKAGYNLRLRSRDLHVSQAAREGESFLKEYIH
jgi:predicted metallopeptidase